MPIRKVKRMSVTISGIIIIVSMAILILRIGLTMKAGKMRSGKNAAAKKNARNSVENRGAENSDKRKKRSLKIIGVNPHAKTQYFKRKYSSEKIFKTAQYF
jgi:hypothetical protein